MGTKMIRLYSFGYRYRKPPTKCFLDVRTLLQNPVHLYQHASALDSLDIRQYVRNSHGYMSLVQECVDRIMQGATQFSIGCIGGRHRSVTLVEDVRYELEKKGLRVSATHLELPPQKDIASNGVRKE